MNRSQKMAALSKQSSLAVSKNAIGQSPGTNQLTILLNQKTFGFVDSAKRLLKTLMTKC
jgi:hypothetical protein